MKSKTLSTILAIMEKNNASGGLLFMLLIGKIHRNLARCSRRLLQTFFHFAPWHTSPLTERIYSQDIIRYLNRKPQEHRGSIVEIGCGLSNIIRHLHYQSRTGLNTEPNLLRAPAVWNKITFNKSITFEQFHFPKTSLNGRFSVWNNTIRCLEDLGYKVDTSVVSNIVWNDTTSHGTEDYSKAPEQPYFVGDSSLIKSAAKGTILEVPISVLRTRKFYRQNLISLRPGYNDYSQMVKLAQSFMKKYSSTDLTVLNMMFHNVEVLPGKSRRPVTEEGCGHFLIRWKSF